MRPIAMLLSVPLLVKRFYAALAQLFMTTCEGSPHMGRITDAMASKAFFRDNNLPPLSPECDRVMICGAIAMFKGHDQRLRGHL